MTDVVTTRDPQVQDLLDKQAIREVTMRYCRGVDRCDPALISSAYHPDAIDQHSSRTFTGETVGAGIADWVRSSTKRSTHQITNQSIRVDGDTAGCESYYVCFQLEDHDGGERMLQAIGRYVDRLERRNGEWRISRRVVVNEMVRYLAPGDVPNGGPLDLSKRDHSDPSYGVLGA
jgi:ketosteroid isomerase-like protein